jgi:predicted DNA-binding protein (MmcQ/YjbR family)
VTGARKPAASRRDALRRLAESLPGAVVDRPWADDLVYKVGGKIFVFFGADDRSPASMMVSCGPDAAEWRDRYPGDITVGPYIGRYGWNSVLLDGDVATDDLHELLELSYDRVVGALPKSKRPQSGVRKQA